MSDNGDGETLRLTELERLICVICVICVGEILKVKVESLKRLYYLKTCFRERFHTQKVRML